MEKESVNNYFKKINITLVIIICITYTIFFTSIFIKRNYDYSSITLSFVSLITSSGFISLYNFITRRKPFAPMNENEINLKEDIKDLINISTVIINVVHVCLVYIVKNDVIKYLTTDKATYIMSFITSIIIMINLLFTNFKNYKELKKQQ